MSNFYQNNTINLIQEVILFLNFNYNFTYNSNNDSLEYQYLNQQAEYGNIGRDGIAKISRELHQRRNIVCPSDLLGGILYSIKSGLRYSDSGYFD